MSDIFLESACGWEKPGGRTNRDRGQGWITHGLKLSDGYTPVSHKEQLLSGDKTDNTPLTSEPLAALFLTLLKLV